MCGLVTQGGSTGSCGCLAAVMPSEDYSCLLRCAGSAAAEQHPALLGYLALSIPELPAKPQAEMAFQKGNQACMCTRVMFSL